MFRGSFLPKGGKNYNFPPTKFNENEERKQTWVVCIFYLHAKMFRGRRKFPLESIRGAVGGDGGG